MHGGLDKLRIGRWYWVTRSSVRTAHSFACSAPLTHLLAPHCSLSSRARSFTPELMGKLIFDIPESGCSITVRCSVSSTHDPATSRFSQTKGIILVKFLFVKVFMTTNNWLHCTCQHVMKRESHTKTPVIAWAAWVWKRREQHILRTTLRWTTSPQTSRAVIVWMKIDVHY